jgi:hypothetical protein
MASTTRLPPPLKAEAQAYADGLGISLNALVIVALRDYLDARVTARAGVAVGVHREVDSQAPGRRAALPPAGREPVAHSQAQAARPVRQVVVEDFQSGVVPRVGANQPCPCGSGQKYKRCHGKP